MGITISGANLSKLLLGISLLPCALSGATYYVSQSIGNDINDGLAVTRPWRTLARASSRALMPGDSVLLNRGDRWNEFLAVPGGGRAGAPVTFDAYGSGPLPVIDGTGLWVPGSNGVVTVWLKQWVVLANLEIRGSSRDGIMAYNAHNLVVRNCSIHGHQFNGFMSWDSNGIVIDSSDIWGNSLNLSSNYAGIRIDGSNVAGFRLVNSMVHDNIGGASGFNNPGNGVHLGHTGNPPTLTGIVLDGNDIHHNGNPAQNQAGRGVTGMFHGDVTLAHNYIHENASAGIYIGDAGAMVSISILHNTFYNNSLRQFGGITNLRGLAVGNSVLVDNPYLTAMGTEVGGSGQWTFTRNVFTYPYATTDTYRGFIRLNEASTAVAVQSDYNIFTSAGPNRWITPTGARTSLSQWQALGYDLHSKFFGPSN